MAHIQHRSHKLVYFLLGIAVPLGGYLLWSRALNCQFCHRREERDRLQEIAVEDSFPASDPPASW
jgi:hypothetical protein